MFSFADHPLLQPLTQARRPGLVTDMDGTVSPIVSDPRAARLTPRNHELLNALQARLPLVAVISGRSATDVQARVSVSGVVYIGNHGMDRWHEGQVEITPAAVRARPALQAALAEVGNHRLDGMTVEDKVATASIHYRNTTDPIAAARTLRPLIQEVAERHGLRWFEGRMVFELRPPVEIHKGTALRDLIEEYQLEAAVFLGDDTTDADALTMARSLRQAGTCHAVGIGVNTAETPAAVREAADLLVIGIGGVEEFLAGLLAQIG